MEKKVNWLITGNSIVVNYDGQTHQLSKSDGIAPKLIEALKERRFEDIPQLIQAEKRLSAVSEGMFTVVDGEIFVDGVVAPRALGRKIEEFSAEGLPYEPLVKFAKNLQSNPSFRAVNELYQFLEKNNHPVTDTGCFIAYKKVGRNFKDLYTGTMDNSVGQVVEMPRNQVNEDPNQTCSHGLHVANWGYAAHTYGSSDDDIMLEVEVNPADVVAVPVDYNQAKMRVCKYKVLSVVNEELSTTTLRVTQEAPARVEETEEVDDDEVQYCNHCDVAFDVDALDGDDLCPDCRVVYCEDCGTMLDVEYGDGNDRCVDCIDEDEESSDEDDLEELEDDEYPWDDEFDN